MKSNYEEKKANRLEAFQRLAASNELKFESLYNSAKKMQDCIPFGQPILIGHHSEKGDRNFRNKIHNKFGKAFEASDKAKYYEDRAEIVENSTAISSDNPDAIELLRAKLASLETNQELMKNCNKVIKNKKLQDVEKVYMLMQLGLKESTAIEALKPVYGKLGLPSFKLTNNNANIRTTKERIAHLERLAAIESSEEEINGVKLVVSSEDNRVQIFFPSIPSEDTRKKLKQSGFHWSPSVGAWMRQISNHAIYLAKQVLNNL